MEDPKTDQFYVTGSHWDKSVVSSEGASCAYQHHYIITCQCQSRVVASKTVYTKDNWCEAWWAELWLFFWGEHKPFIYQANLVPAMFLTAVDLWNLLLWCVVMVCVFVSFKKDSEYWANQTVTSFNNKLNLIDLSNSQLQSKIISESLPLPSFLYVLVDSFMNFVKFTYEILLSF